jgi:hypothetical protein
VRHVPPTQVDKIRQALDDGKYAYSWYENAQKGSTAEDASGEGDASGAGLTSHF